MKKCIQFKCFLFLLLGMPNVLFATQVNMNVYPITQAEPQWIDIDEIDKIHFPSEDEMVVKTKTEDVKFLTDAVRVITFDNLLATAIANVVAANGISITFRPQESEVIVVGNEIIKSVQIYNIQGVCVCSKKSESQEVSIKLPDSESGIYIVVAQSNSEVKTEKIVKQ